MRKKMAMLLLSMLIVFISPTMGNASQIFADEPDYLTRMNALIPQPFEADHYLTREEYFTAVACVFLIDNDFTADATLPFTDASEVNLQNRVYLAALYSKGIIVGGSGVDPNGPSIRPGALITRQEAVTLLGRLVGSPTDGLITFSDASDIAPYARGYVAWFVERGIIGGYPDGSFGPDDLMTASQLAALTMKTRDYQNAAGKVDPVVISDVAVTYRPSLEIEVTVCSGMGNNGALNGSNQTAQFNLPQAVFENGGYLYVTDTYNNLIRKISSEKTETLAGDIKGLDDTRFPKGYYLDGDLKTALFNRPMGGVVSGGKLFIVDSQNHAIRAITAQKVYTYAGGQAGYADGAADKALFNGLSAIAADKNGCLYVADTLNHCIRKIDAKGKVTTLAGVPGQEGCIEGGASRALFRCPSGIAVSEDGAVVYVADTGNHRICKIENKSVTTLAGGLANIATDEDGDPLGAYADGSAKEAMFNLPVGLSLVNGVLVVADSGNHRIRAITRAGDVVTLAGSGEPGDKTGYAADASFNLPAGIYATADVLYIADTGNNKIKQMPLDAVIFN